MIAPEQRDTHGVPARPRAEITPPWLFQNAEASGSLGRQGELDPGNARVDAPEIREMERQGLQVPIKPLLQVKKILPPVDVAIDQVFRSPQRTTHQVVEIRQGMGIDPEAAEDRPGQAAGHESSPDPAIARRWDTIRLE